MLQSISTTTNRRRHAKRSRTKLNEVKLSKGESKHLAAKGRSRLK